VPETAENFRQLCNGTHKLSYKNTKLTKAVPNLLIEAGNVGGDGSETIYGKGMWKERTDDSKFDKRGIVAMVDCAPEKNGSKFFITLGDFTHLDYTQVVVGEVIEGLNEVYLLSRTGDNTGTPRVEVSISDCGEGETLHLVEPHHHGHGHH
jgi:cyclophilin family peptidyl-prolyl cis-trans isomerase